MKPDTPSMQEISRQLRCPTGDAGQNLAGQMNQSNHGINMLCIEKLNTNVPAPHILEIGPGNGGFLPAIFERFPRANYTGIDWSEDMVNLARTEQASYVQAQQAQFQQGEAHQLTFEDDAFDLLLSVNTLYFWPDLIQTLREFARVLTSEGQLVLGFGDIAFMQPLPFTAENFQMYTLETVQTAAREAGFKSLNNTEFKESVQDDNGQTFYKHYHCLRAKC